MKKNGDSKKIGMKEMAYQLFSGLLWWQLEWVGPAYALVTEKRIITGRKAVRSSGTLRCLVVEAEKVGIRALKFPSLSEYNRMKVGACYEDAHFIRHKKLPVAWVVKSSEASKGISEIFLKSLLMTVFFLIVMGLFVVTLGWMLLDILTHL